MDLFKILKPGVKVERTIREPLNPRLADSGMVERTRDFFVVSCDEVKLMLKTVHEGLKVTVRWPDPRLIAVRELERKQHAITILRPDLDWAAAQGRDEEYAIMHKWFKPTMVIKTLSQAPVRTYVADFEVVQGTHTADWSTEVRAWDVETAEGLALLRCGPTCTVNLLSKTAVCNRSGRSFKLLSLKQK